ncbi:MAG: hypothetical protein KHY71_05795 [Anaerotruncus sp.]|nr:hypothetical protein [Anaerotruncus sp.]
MNKGKIKQLRDALIVIKEECASHGFRCPQSCPFHNGEGGCGICAESPSNWELNSDSFFEWHAFT